MPVRSQPLDDTHHAGGKHIGWCGQDARQFHPQEALSLSHRDAPFQQEGSNLIDDASALADQPLTDAMQSLQVELIGGLGATNFIVGRCTASAIASASRKSFFWPL